VNSKKASPMLEAAAIGEAEMIWFSQNVDIE